MPEKLKAHLVRTQDIVDYWNGSPFGDITEAKLDTENYMISDVCVFGTRESKNGYVYSDKAVNTLTRMAHGAKFFFDHPAKEEEKQRDGVRSVKDWAGIFTNPRREQDKVFADLMVRESCWDLVKDVALMQPSGFGNSINSRVKMFKDEKGLESILDIETLKSIDLVASAATTNTLFESYREPSEEDRALEEGRLKVRMDLGEGILKDRIEDREVRRAVNRLQYDALDVIDEIFKDQNKAFPDKKKEISSVLNDLESMINDFLSGKKKPGKNGTIYAQQTEKKEEVDEMKDLTIEALKKERPDIFDAIRVSFEDANRIGKLGTDFNELKTKFDELNTAHETQGTELTTLKTENEDLKKKLDAYEQNEKKTAKESLIDQKIKDAKLPDEAITEVFRNDLLMKDETGIEAAIQDRKDIWTKSTSKIKGAGGEFIPKLESKVSVDEEKAKTDFLKNFGN